MDTQFGDGSGFVKHALGGAAEGEDLRRGLAKVIEDGAVRGSVEAEKEGIGMDQAASEEVDDKGGLKFLVVALGTGTVDGVSGAQVLLAASGVVKEGDGKARVGILDPQHASAVQGKLVAPDQGVLCGEHRRSRPVAMRLPERPDVTHETPALGKWQGLPDSLGMWTEGVDNGAPVHTCGGCLLDLCADETDESTDGHGKVSACEP